MKAQKRSKTIIKAGSKRPHKQSRVKRQSVSAQPSAGSDVNVNTRSEESQNLSGDSETGYELSQTGSEGSDGIPRSKMRVEELAESAGPQTRPKVQEARLEAGPQEFDTRPKKRQIKRLTRSNVPKSPLDILKVESAGPQTQSNTPLVEIEALQRLAKEKRTKPQECAKKRQEQSKLLKTRKEALQTSSGESEAGSSSSTGSEVLELLPKTSKLWLEPVRAKSAGPVTRSKIRQARLEMQQARCPLKRTWSEPNQQTRREMVTHTGLYAMQSEFEEEQQTSTSSKKLEKVCLTRSSSESSNIGTEATHTRLKKQQTRTRSKKLETVCLTRTSSESSNIGTEATHTQLKKQQTRTRSKELETVCLTKTSSESSNIEKEATHTRVKKQQTRTSSKELEKVCLTKTSSESSNIRKEATLNLEPKIWTPDEQEPRAEINEGIATDSTEDQLTGLKLKPEFAFKDRSQTGSESERPAQSEATRGLSEKSPTRSEIESELSKFLEEDVELQSKAGSNVDILNHRPLSGLDVLELLDSAPELTVDFEIFDLVHEPQSINLSSEVEQSKSKLNPEFASKDRSQAEPETDRPAESEAPADKSEESPTGSEADRELAKFLEVEDEHLLSKAGSSVEIVKYRLLTGLDILEPLDSSPKSRTDSEIIDLVDSPPPLNVSREDGPSRSKPNPELASKDHLQTESETERPAESESPAGKSEESPTGSEADRELAKFLEVEDEHLLSKAGSSVEIVKYRLLTGLDILEPLDSSPESRADSKIIDLVDSPPSLNVSREDGSSRSKLNPVLASKDHLQTESETERPAESESPAGKSEESPTGSEADRELAKFLEVEDEYLLSNAGSSVEIVKYRLLSGLDILEPLDSSPKSRANSEIIDLVHEPPSRPLSREDGLSGSNGNSQTTTKYNTQAVSKEPQASTSKADSGAGSSKEQKARSETPPSSEDSLIGSDEDHGLQAKDTRLEPQQESSESEPKSRSTPDAELDSCSPPRTKKKRRKTKKKRKKKGKGGR